MISTQGLETNQGASPTGAILQAPSATRAGWGRWTPLTGIAFVIFFIGSVVASNPPSATASDKAWIAAYATQGKQTQHMLTGIFLVLAGLCLLAFLTHLWTRVLAAGGPAPVSPIPVAGAAVSAACFGVAGVLMGGISGTLLFSGGPVPGAGLLRLGNDLGFAMVGLPGMLATSLTIACLAVQARAAGIFGKGLLIFSLAVSVVLLGSILFAPILLLLIWLVVIAIVLMRKPVQSQVAKARTV